MSLFSFLRKKGQESGAGDGTYYSRAEEDSKATASRKRRTASTARRDDPVDPVLPEKKRARRRLVGAVALVLAAVIGLPMILDSEPKPPADDIAIHIPSRDTPAPVASATPAVSQVQPAAPATVVDEEKKEEFVEIPATKSTAAAPPPQAAQNAPVQTAQAKPIEQQKAAAPAKPAEMEKRAAPAKPVPKADSPARNDDGARALALLEGRSDPRKAEQKGEKFVVQVAALASQEKVNELQGKLKRAGIESYTQKVATQSGHATRIRVGPFGSREEAEKMRARIVKLGLGGTLVPA